MADRDKSLTPFNFPLNGRLITKLDGTLLPDSHFQVLENLRYNDGGIEAISGGMTKINATVLPKLKVQNGFFFKKAAPNTESHIFIQVTNPADKTSAIYKSDGSDASVPEETTFSLFHTLTSDNTVYFTEAPDQSIVYCNGIGNYIWSGEEYRCGKFINFDPGGSFSYDYTVQANNNITNADNVFTLSRVLSGLLPTTEGLWKFDDNLNDSSGKAKTLTGVGTPTYTTGLFEKALALNGSSQYVYRASDADFDMSGGQWTFDGRIYVTSLAAERPIWFWKTDADNYVKLFVTTGGAISFVIYDTGDKVVELTTPDGVVALNTWTYFEVAEDGDVWYLYAGTSGLATLYDIDEENNNRAVLYSENFTLGYDETTYFAGYMDEFRFNSTIIHTEPFQIPITAYTDEYGSHVYVGSTRPISGVKYYVDTANTTTGTVVGYYWDGSAWVLLSSLVDGTATAGKPLAKTGSITFSSTVDTAKVKVIEENIAYFYYFVFYGIDATTKLKEVTVYAPPQELVDIWDGTPRQVYSCIRRLLGKSTDYTPNVYALDYNANIDDTYVSIGGLTSSGWLAFGFNERVSAIKIFMGGTSVNEYVRSLSVQYWNGSEWTSVGSIEDGTSVNGRTLSRTGIISWNAPSRVNEFPVSVANSSKWYYYRLVPSGALSIKVRIDHVQGIPVQSEIPPYRYPLLWQNRLWLLNDQSKAANAALGSSYGTACVFNGTDSGLLLFGGSKGLTAGATLFTRFGGSLYENMIVCKSNETYLVDGVSFTGEYAFVVYQVSGVRGCIAPLTMKACDTGYEVAAGVTKHVLTWLSNSGVVMFDTNSIIEVSSDVDDKVSVGIPGGISSTLASSSFAFYDATRGEYHLLIPTGTTPTYLTEELVYDTIRKRWYNIKRGTKYLWCGFQVEDSSGNAYVYGGTGDGYIERLENGTTFDGVAIAYKFRLPDSLLNQSWDTRKEIRQIRLVGKCKTTTTQTVAVTHYADGNTTASTPAIIPFANNKAGRRFYKFVRSVSLRGCTHSLEFSISTTNESGGFAPLYVSGLYKVIDYDMEET